MKTQWAAAAERGLSSMQHASRHADEPSAAASTPPQAQQAMLAAASPEELHLLLDAQPWGLLALDGDDCVVFANDAALQLLGRAVSVGMPLAHALPELDIGPGEQAEEAERFDAPSTCDHAGGTPPRRGAPRTQGVELLCGERWLWLRIVAQDTPGRIAAIATLTDITDLRRTLDNRMQSLRFLSHDLRSPQNSIVALTQLHEHDPVAFERCGGMARIAELARYALSLGDQFIFTSVADALAPRDFKRFDLRAAIRALVPQLDVAAVYRSVALRLWLAEDVPIWMSGVRVFVARALQNLIDNAIQASPAGSRVTVSVDVRDSLAIVTISDEARGLPGLARGPITDFGRLGEKSAGGFGIGLQLAARIVRLHGGAIEALANPEGGTDFTVSLPCLRVRHDGDAHAQLPPAPGGGNCAAKRTDSRLQNPWMDRKTD